LEAEGRLLPEGARESNVVFRMPYDTVMAMWRRCITAAYTPEALYERFVHNIRHTFAHRKDVPLSPQRASWSNVVMGFELLARILWKLGVRGNYRRTFWRFAWPALKSGKIEFVIHIGVVSHHLIEFTRDCLTGRGESAFYKIGGPERR